jgi:hypothetical protein
MQALLVLLVACSGRVITTTTVSNAESGTTPSVCAAGFAEYLVKIEPIVGDFDPTTMAFSEFFEIADAAGEMLDSDLTAPVSCEDEGLNWAYSSWQSAWDEILSIARDQAPGTIPFMEASRQLASLDEPAMADVPMPSCQEAVIDLEQAIDDQLAAGNEALLDVPFEQAIEIVTVSFYITFGEDDGPTCMPDDLRAKVDAFFPPRPSPEITTTVP